MKPMRNRLIPLLAVALLAAACGGNGGNGTPDPTTTTTVAGGTEITIRTTEFAFDPDNIQAPAGVPVTLILVNDGVVEHDFSIDEIDLHILVQPGETQRETVTFTAGTYEVHCTVPGHHEAGMTATLVAG